MFGLHITAILIEGRQLRLQTVVQPCALQTEFVIEHVLGIELKRIATNQGVAGRCGNDASVNTACLVATGNGAVNQGVVTGGKLQGDIAAPQVFAGVAGNGQRVRIIGVALFQAQAGDQLQAFTQCRVQLSVNGGITGVELTVKTFVAVQGFVFRAQVGAYYPAGAATEQA